MRLSPFVFAAALLVACGPPLNNTPVEQIPSIKSLEAVMDVQATAADPQFKKIGEGSYSEADFAAFAEAARRIDATSKHLKDFSKGPEFDAFATKLNETALQLSKAAEAKDTASSKDALTTMKATCKGCHSKFR
jgi:cytochrome c556